MGGNGTVLVCRNCSALKESGHVDGCPDSFVEVNTIELLAILQKQYVKRFEGVKGRRVKLVNFWFWDIALAIVFENESSEDLREPFIVLEFERSTYEYEELSLRVTPFDKVPFGLLRELEIIEHYECAALEAQATLARELMKDHREKKEYERLHKLFGPITDEKDEALL